MNMVHDAPIAWESLGDEELVQHARQGSSEAFTELMRRNGNASRKLAASVLRDVEEAEDAMQDAWSKAWQHVANFHGESKFSTWFTRIVLNQCLMRLRSSKRRPTMQLEESASPDSDRPVMQFATDDAGPEEQFATAEMRSLIRREIALLPPLLREPLILRDLDQLPIETVAQRLESSVPAVKSRLLRARSELRKRLERHVGPGNGPAAAGGSPLVLV